MSERQKKKKNTYRVDADGGRRWWWMRVVVDASAKALTKRCASDALGLGEFLCKFAQPHCIINQFVIY